MLKVANSVINASQITGVLPVVNGGTGVTTSTGTGNTVLSATPTLSGDVTLSTGNLIIGTSGKGIDFSATPGAGTSELLADYEEGIWTPIFASTGTNPTVTYSVQQGSYVKIGKLVYASFYLGTTLIVGGTGRLLIGGLPFTNQNVNESDRSCLVFGLITGFSSTTTPTAGILASNSTLIHLYTNNSADARDNKSTDVSCPLASAPGLYGTIVYRAAA